MRHIKIREWKDLHPAPAVIIPDKNCCECIFAESQLKSTVYCTMKSTYMGLYDECSAFSKKQTKETP